MKSINSGAGVRHKRGKQRIAMMKYYVPRVRIYTAPRVSNGYRIWKDSKPGAIARARSAACRACTKHANTSSSNFGPRRMRCNAKANGFVNATPPKN